MKVELGMKNLAMLPNYFEFIFVLLSKTERMSQARIKSKILLT